ncbi:hypothetical protein HRbin24_00551 [bacterium HR24]|nr:hypothetical protein HRbin24_00551 [bacterium HR24]
MESLFIDPEARHRIYLRDLPVPRLEGSEDWVEVYAELPYGVAVAVEREGLRARMLLSSSDARGAEIPLELDLLAARRALLVHAILDWSLADKDGRKVPVGTVEERRRAIERLPDWLVRALMDAVDSYYASRRLDAKNRPAGAAFREGAEGAG